MQVKQFFAKDKKTILKTVINDWHYYVGVIHNGEDITCLAITNTDVNKGKYPAVRLDFTDKGVILSEKNGGVTLKQDGVCITASKKPLPLPDKGSTMCLETEPNKGGTRALIWVTADGQVEVSLHTKSGSTLLLLSDGKIAEGKHLIDEHHEILTDNDVPVLKGKKHAEQTRNNTQIKHACCLRKINDRLQSILKQYRYLELEKLDPKYFPNEGSNEQDINDLHVQVTRKNHKFIGPYKISKDGRLIEAGEYGKNGVLAEVHVYDTSKVGTVYRYIGIDKKTGNEQLVTLSDDRPSETYEKCTAILDKEGNLQDFTVRGVVQTNSRAMIRGLSFGNTKPYGYEDTEDIGLHYRVQCKGGKIWNAYEGTHLDDLTEGMRVFNGQVYTKEEFEKLKNTLLKSKLNTQG